MIYPARLGFWLIFLSIQAQDFIEETLKFVLFISHRIPEHSSSGLH